LGELVLEEIQSLRAIGILLLCSIHIVLELAKSGVIHITLLTDITHLVVVLMIILIGVVGKVNVLVSYRLKVLTRLL
jgi:hypothetical protein